MARLKAEHLVELRRLFEINTAMAEFFSTTEPGFAKYGDQLRDILVTTFEQQDLRGMRAAAQELRNMSTALNPAARADLRESVRRATGHSLEHEEARDPVLASRILQRARIRNDREYYALRSRLDHIEGRPGHEEEERAIFSLLDSHRAGPGAV